MCSLIFFLFVSFRSWFQGHLHLQAEIVALRHQLMVPRRSQRGRVQLRATDRFFWVGLSRLWSGWCSALAIVKPETVISWHRKGFRLYWAWKSGRGTPGMPEVSEEVRDLIRKMSKANPLWGAPRIHGELLKLGSEVLQATVAKYMARQRKPPSQTWRTFLNNHVKELVSTDFFVVLTLSFRVLYVFIVLVHDRRRVLHFNVTAHPSAEWTAQQMAEAFPWDSAPRYLLHDRDSIYGDPFRQRVREMGMRQVLTAPRSPWQNPYVERLVGSVRRDCLDHIVVFSESSLCRTLKFYFDYYQRSRTHPSLDKDAPEPRAVQPREFGTVVEMPQVGGLHHRYERRVARRRVPSRRLCVSFQVYRTLALDKKPRAQSCRLLMGHVDTPR